MKRKEGEYLQVKLPQHIQNSHMQSNTHNIYININIYLFIYLYLYLYHTLFVHPNQNRINLLTPITHTHTHTHTEGLVSQNNQCSYIRHLFTTLLQILCTELFIRYYYTVIVKRNKKKYK